MKKLLPIFLLWLVLFQYTLGIRPVFAQVLPTPTTPATPTAPGPPTSTPYMPTAPPTTPLPTPPDDTWVTDSEVTFVGKTGARSGKFLDWALQRYEWSYVNPGETNPLLPFWATIRNIIYVFSALFVLITAFILIATRGRSLTITRFIPRFIAVLLLVTFSFSILQFIYQIADAIMGFFIRNKAGNIISQKDLLYVGFDYETFIGFRKIGFLNDESAFITLLLTKLTALTYYVMTGVLLVRKVILWFFIVISPIFPVLLLYYPVRNTAKIWIGEFFRWLLYGPLFALFLSGLVNLWSSTIPLKFDYSTPGKLVGTDIMYPTVVNILLGGPGQAISIVNSVNLPDTFALYVIALIMLWVATLLPFVLLQIFLDYLQQFKFSDNWAVRQIVNSSASFLNKPLAPAPAGTPPYPPAQPSGKGKTLPFMSRITIPQIKQQPAGMAKELPQGMARQMPSSTTTSQFEQRFYQAARPLQTQTEILRLSNISVPTMRDIARYETAQMSRQSSDKSEVTRVQQTLERIANPQLVTNTIERDRFTQLKEKLVRESKQGNSVATTILSAVSAQSRVSSSTQTEKTQSLMQQIANPQSIETQQTRDRITQLKEKLTSESKQGNQVATTVLSAVKQLSQATTQEQQTTIIKELKETLTKEKEKGNQLAETVLSEVTNTVSTSEVHDVLSKLTSSTSTTTSEREKITQLKESLQQGAQQGNPLATSVMSVIDNMTQSEVSKTQSMLQQISNPQSVSSSTQKEQLTQLKDRLVRESQQGNQVATTILQTTEKLSQTTNQQERQTMISQLRETLVKESEKGNTLATTLLSEIDKQTSQQEVSRMSQVLQQISNPSSITSDKEREKFTSIKEQLTQQGQQGTLATTILQATEKISQAKTQDEKTTVVQQLKEVLQKESEKGNTLATQLLESSQITSKDQLKQVQEKIKEARDKGEPLANSLLSLVQEAVGQTDLAALSTTLPAANKVQTVSVEDYEAVKKMWQENYHNMDVPLSLTNNNRDRKQWIQDDVGKLNDTINLLTSTDQQKVQEGMKNVSELLPFLLIGGFSQTEIVTYLKAKMEAAKSTQEELSKQVDEDEETMVSVQTKRATATKHMAASAEGSTRSSFSEEAAAESELSHMPKNLVYNRTYNKTVVLQPQIKTDVLQLSNLTLPTIHDIVKYETNMLSSKDKQTSEVTKIYETLQKIANPEKETNTTQREQYATLKEKLVSESKQGNPVAASLLQAVSTMGGTVSDTMLMQTAPLQNVLGNISNPQLVTDTTQRSTYEKIKEQVLAESQKGNPLATAILAAEKDQSPEAIERVRQQLMEGKQKGDVLATAVTSSLLQATQAPGLPAQNRIQQVSLEDYEAVKSMWKENYQLMDVPLSHEGTQRNRKEWVAGDINKISDTISLLTSTDQQKVQEGMKNVSDILPFLLIGGFSQQEIVTYLKAKLEAAKTVQEEISTQVEEEDTTIPVETRKTVAKQHMTATMEESTNESAVSAEEEAESEIGHMPRNLVSNRTFSKPIVLMPEVKVEILQQLNNLALPTIHDIVKYETTMLSSKGEQTTEVNKIVETLQKIANPEKETNTTQREQYASMKEKLVTESKQGNPVAASILTAATNMSESTRQMVSLQSVIQNIANPQSVSNVSQQSVYQQINQQVASQSQQGNPLARAIFDSEKTPTPEKIQQIRQSLLQAKAKGDTLATSILGMTEQAAESTALPAQNQIQQVSLEDYEAVKQMWQENYHNMDVPQSITNNTRDRKQWVQEDITKISDTIGLLTSNEQQKVQEGMKQVSNILPFLLIGGFSQQEIVAYMKAKLEAAKSIQTELAKVEEDEETMVSVENRRSTTAKRQMSATMKEQTSENEREESSTTEHMPKNLISNRTYAKPIVLMPEVKTEILQQLHNLALPTIHDIVKYETTMISTKGEQPAEVTKLVETLQKIANPESESNTTEREQLVSLKEKLVTESKQGNPVAASILSAVEVQKQALDVDLRKMQIVISQILHPETVTSVAEKERFTQIKDQLTKESQQGNKLASSILGMEKDQSPAQSQTVRQMLLQAKAKGDPLASAIISAIGQPASSSSALPVQNRIQQVSLDDYESVRSMWEENYKLMDVPTSINGEQKERKQWIQDDVSQISQTIDLLASNDAAKVQEGIKQVSQILPFLLIGGFSQQEVVAYLKAKQAAGKSALQQLQEQSDAEETMVTVETRQAAAPRQMSASTERVVSQSTAESAGTSSVSSPTVIQQQSKGDLLKMSNLQLPTMYDIAKYEATLMSSKDQQPSEIKAVYETLQKIANPEKETKTKVREQYSSLKEKLVSESKQGNPLASSILTAANTAQPTIDPSAIQTSHIQSVLEKIANPAIILNNVERQQFVQLQGQLVKESQKNPLAANLLTTVGALAQSETSFIHETLKYIADPNSATPAQHQQIAQLKEQLIKESQEGNQLAIHILSVSNAFKEINLSPETQIAIADLLKEKLLQEKEQGNPFVRELLQATDITLETSVIEFNQILQELLNPETISATKKRQEYTTLKEKLLKESQSGDKVASSIVSVMGSVIKAAISEEGRLAILDIIREKLLREKEKGNKLAAFILALTPTAPENQIDQIKQQLLDAKAKGDPLASGLLDVLLQAVSASTQLPSENKVQQVNLEDYEAVRAMWEENFRQMEVPVGPDGSQRDRKAWLLDEITQITEAINLLSSDDPELIKEGLKKVSQILPFLLIGGFSRQEVIAYLKAKLAAAKAVLGELEKAQVQDQVEVNVSDKKKEQENMLHVDESNLKEPELIKETDILEETSNDNKPDKS